MNKIISILLFGMLFGACKKQDNLENYMLDFWQTSYIKIEMPTFKKSDSTYTFIDDFSKINAVKAQSSYYNDGTYASWYLQSDGNQVGKITGAWKIKKDSLLIAYEQNNKVIKVAYLIEKTKEGFKAKSKYDWDNDGEKDDFLIMETKRVNEQ